VIPVGESGSVPTSPSHNPSETWLDYYGLKSDPFRDIMINTEDNLKYLVTTSTITTIAAEVKDIIRSPVGLVKPVVGTRGSGKTAALYYLVHQLRGEKSILPCYVNMRESIPYIRESPFPLVLSRAFVMREVVRTIISNGQFVEPALLDRHPTVKDMWERVTAWAPTPRTVPKIATSDLDILLKTLHTYGRKVVLAIDEFDKMTEPSELVTLSDFFRSEQAFFTELASNLKTFIYLSASTKWDFMSSSELSYLKKTLVVFRLTPVEAKSILVRRFEVDNPGVKPPFTDDAIAGLVSIVRGNARDFIFKSGEVLKVAYDKNRPQVDRDLLSDVYGNDMKASLHESFQEIVKGNDLAAKGAFEIFEVCVPKSREQRRSYLTALMKLYREAPLDSPESKALVLDLERQGWIYRSPIDGRKPRIYDEIRVFLREWEGFGHLLEDFVDWYSMGSPEPAGLPQTYRYVRDTCRRISEAEAISSIEASWTKYRQLDRPNDPVEIVGTAYEMLKDMMKGYCQHVFGLPSARLLTGTILEAFERALSTSDIQFELMGFIYSVSNIAARTGPFSSADATAVMEPARRAYSEFMRQWNESISRENGMGPSVEP
jgi:Cdc6-like AAA superfamily ATPase